MIVATLAALGQWFAGKSAGFRNGTEASAWRAWDPTQLICRPPAARFYERGWQPPLWFAATIMALGLIGAAAYWWVDANARARGTQPAATSTDRIRLVGCLALQSLSYWFLVALCVLFYSVIFPFRSTVCDRLLSARHGLPLGHRRPDEQLRVPGRGLCDARVWLDR